MKKKKWSDNWGLISDNAATIAGIANKDETEQKIAELSAVVYLKCGYKPNIRKELPNGTLIGYVENECGYFDPMLFNPKCFARLKVQENEKEKKMSNNVLDNKPLLLVLFGGMFLVLTLAMVTIVPNKIKKDLKQEIMQEIQRDYTPGPYAPGFDPDKIDPVDQKHHKARQ